MGSKKMFQLLVVAGALTAVVAMAGCSSANDTSTTKSDSAPVEQKKAADSSSSEQGATKDTVSLADWNGTWNDMGSYLDDSELSGAYKEVADRDGKPAEEVKSALQKRRHCDFHGLVIDGNNMTFLDGLKDKGGKETGNASYTFKEKHIVEQGTSQIEWDEFSGSDGAKYKVVLMMPIHGEETMTHFHMRYGDSAEALLAKDGWFPTFVKPDTTYDQLKSEITE